MVQPVMVLPPLVRPSFRPMESCERQARQQQHGDGQQVTSANSQFGLDFHIYYFRQDSEVATEKQGETAAFPSMHGDNLICAYGCLM